MATDRDLLRFATAGSVDDGKSTLVGRLLYDTKSVLADQIEAVHRASVDKGLTTPDLSLLVDGLRAEREQGITIDVAYRYFSTPKREFVLADTPGHVQYTRNTVTGASTAELAVLLVDARNGVVEQTRRHAAVLALLRVPRLVLAINKIDLVEYDEGLLTAIGKDFASLARSLGFSDDAVVTIPLSALVGDNVVDRSPRTPWYEGPTLISHLESVPVAGPEVSAPFRLPVQYVIRDGATDYRGYAGQVAAGTVAPGDAVVVLPGGAHSTVTSVDTADGPLPAAGAGRSVTVRLADDIDLARGDVIAAADSAPTVTSELDATLCWLSDRPLRPGSRLLLKHGTRTTQVIVG
ncbi:MAG: sulfate adenylyltransferase subunit 1, partial [Pseudonocardiales bacterium]|nr:sulfate adenylyltransferase subunit 1 [Pseudonocardiales bacterium]